ncbi:Methyltransferase type 11 [Dillenia turbinata]|uniref:Methyltransferase type 11 n=1 Tax=Dillenia turbinata TaxID=194707 RepID=A0AAN8UM38_9MAGN
MATLFVKQAKDYSLARPHYPQQLFQFIASKTLQHDLAWDVGTGSGQAAESLAGIYKNVIATDTSEAQLEFAPKLPNIQYKRTPPKLTMEELKLTVAQESTIDVITVAQAVHWFDLSTFYQEAKCVLKRPHGVMAVWCYTNPRVNKTMDQIFDRFYAKDCGPYWDMTGIGLIDDEYRTLEFPFEPVEGLDHTGPFQFKSEKKIDLEDIFAFIKSWSAYQTAKDKGIELLREEVVEEFEKAWKKDGDGQKVASFPIHLRIGKVGKMI